LIERRLVLAGVFVDGVLIHDRIVHHDRQTIDESFFGDGFGFSRCEVRGTGSCEYQRDGEKRKLHSNVFHNVMGSDKRMR